MYDLVNLKEKSLLRIHLLEYLHKSYNKTFHLLNFFINSALTYFFLFCFVLKGILILFFLFPGTSASHLLAASALHECWFFSSCGPNRSVPRMGGFQSRLASLIIEKAELLRFHSLSLSVTLLSAVLSEIILVYFFLLFLHQRHYCACFPEDQTDW